MVLSVLLAALALPVGAQQKWPFRVATPTSVGIDAAKLGAAAGAIKDLVEDDELLGAVLFVSRGRTIVLHEAYGFRDVACKVPLEKDTLFRMASNTKADDRRRRSCKLVDRRQGRRSHDPVHKWFPDLEERQAAAKIDRAPAADPLERPAHQLAVPVDR